MGYWKDKVLPMFQKVFDRGGSKKSAAADACKAFDDSKEEMNKELEEKREELKPKVLEIYEACTAEIKGLVKERSESGLRKQSSGINKLLEDLARIGFPGSKQASEASSKYGPALISGPVFFIFEKVSTFLPLEEPPAAPTGGSSTEVAEDVKKRELDVSPPPAPPLEEPDVASPVVPSEVPDPAVAVKGESEFTMS